MKEYKFQAADCPKCGKRLRIRTSKQSITLPFKHSDVVSVKFIGCTGYPACHYTEPYEPPDQELLRENRKLWAEIEKLDNLINEFKAFLDRSYITEDTTEGHNKVQELYDEYVEKRKKR